MSNSTLIMFASETRGVARVIATEHGLTIPHLPKLDAAITSHPLWAEEDESDAAAEREPPTTS